jgi:hypothetical protein
VTAGAPRLYEIRVVGRLDDRWSLWFDGLEICGADDGTSTLTGVVADQAQLHGILARLRDVGATLLCCRALTGDGASGPSGTSPVARA